MRYSIIVLISFAINIHLCFARNNFVGAVANSDSLHSMEYLKLEYTFYTAQTEEEKYDALWGKLQIAAFHKENAKLLYEIKRIENLNENQKFLQSSEEKIFSFFHRENFFQLQNSIFSSLN